MKQTVKLKTAILSFALVAGLAWPTSAQEAPVLPGGASSLTETYGDWRVACQLVEATKHCVMSQQQLRQDGQRVVTIELQTGPDAALMGHLVLPFGLQLDAGATLQVDEQPAMAPLSFHTCLPAGCVVRVSFNTEALTALRAGTALQVATRTADTGRDFLISVSLNGFTAALERVMSLSAS